MSPQYERSQLHPFQALSRAGCRAALVADIAEFYPSVYTHAIPWACHTKARAKKNRSLGPFGNRLDKLIRSAQDGQTMGIPIGPDTSFIIAEILLAVVDSALERKITKLVGLRWIDEFEVPTNDRGEAERVLATIQQVLLDFELRLNPRKTFVSDLPIRFDIEWIAELRAFAFRQSAVGQANDLIRYFDTMTRYVAANPNEHIIKYGLGRIRTLKLHQSNFALFQSLVCQAVTSEPGAIREGIQALHYAESKRGLIVDRDLLEMTINRIAEAGAPVGHHYEVSWCLWAAINWNLPLRPSVAAAIARIGNSVVAILALDAARLGLMGFQLNEKLWQARMATVELHDDEWLLAYEANVQGWLGSNGPTDHVLADPNFALLKAANVHFYKRSPTPFTPGALAYP